MQDKYRRATGFVVGLALFSVLSPRLVKGQETTSGTVRGTVRDSSGVALPHAAVSIRSEDTGRRIRTELTNASGDFVAAQLPDGTYAIQVSAPGYKSASIASVIIRDSETRRLTAVLDSSKNTGGVAVRMSRPTGPLFMPEEIYPIWQSDINMDSGSFLFPDVERPPRHNSGLSNAAPEGFLPEEEPSIQ